MPTAPSPSPPEHRALLTLRVVSACGTVIERHRVLCPALDRTRTIADCLNCPASGGAVEGVRERFLLCTHRALPDGAERSARAAAQTPVTRAMSAQVVCVRRDLPLSGLVQLLVERGIHGVPVVDAQGRPGGMVTQSDLTRRLQRGPPPGAGREALGQRAAALGGLCAESLMSCPVCAVPESASLASAARLMTERRMHTLPVVCPEGQVVGMITAFDVMRWVAGEPPPASGEGRGEGSKVQG